MRDIIVHKICQFSKVQKERDRVSLLSPCSVGSTCRRPAGRDASWILKSWQSPQLLLRLTQWPENKLPSLHPRESARAIGGRGGRKECQQGGWGQTVESVEGEGSAMKSSREVAEFRYYLSIATATNWIHEGNDEITPRPKQVLVLERPYFKKSDKNK